MKQNQLAFLLGGGLSLWAVGCLAVHGPAILAYIGLQAATAGLFAWQMRRIEQSLPVRTGQVGLSARKAA